MKNGVFFFKEIFFFGGALGLGQTCLDLEPALSTHKGAQDYGVNHTLLNRRVDFFILTIENEQFAEDMSDVMMLNSQSTHCPKI